MSTTIILLRRTAEIGAGRLARVQHACEAYALLHGWSEPFRPYETTGGGCLDGGEDGPLAPVLGALGLGDRIICQDLRTLSDRPGTLAREVSTLIGRGVSIHVLELGGSILEHIEPLMVAWGMAADVERQLEAEREARTRDRERFEVDFEALAKEILGKVVRVYGLPPSGVEGLAELATLIDPHLAGAAQKAGADVAHEIETDGEQAPEVGTWLRVRREQKGWTQAEAAEALSTSTATISRMEKYGRGQYLTTYALVLEPQIARLGRPATIADLRKLAEAGFGLDGSPSGTPGPKPNGHDTQGMSDPEIDARIAAGKAVLAEMRHEV